MYGLRIMQGGCDAGKWVVPEDATNRWSHYRLGDSPIYPWRTEQEARNMHLGGYRSTEVVEDPKSGVTDGV